MIFKPAHKQDNPALKPGQTVYSFDRYPYVKSGSIAEPGQKTKLTFNEWLPTFTCEDNVSTDTIRQIWNAAQENCK